MDTDSVALTDNKVRETSRNPLSANPGQASIRISRMAERALTSTFTISFLLPRSHTT